MTTYELTSPIGPLEIVPTNAKHICVYNKTHQDLTLRGIFYTCKIHLFHVNGQWTHKAPEGMTSGIYIHRSGLDTKYRSAPVSDSAQKKIIEIVTQTFQEWAAKNNLELYKAEMDDMQNQQERLIGEIAELNEKLDMKQKELQQLNSVIVSYVQLHPELNAKITI